MTDDRRKLIQMTELARNRVIIAGTRGRIDRAFCRAKCIQLLAGVQDPVVLIRDDNTDVDRVAIELAHEMDLTLISFKAFWIKEGMGAGFHRNQHMALAATHAILFWDGFSPDIKDLVRLTREYGLKRKVYILDME